MGSGRPLGDLIIYAAWVCLLSACSLGWALLRYGHACLGRHEGAAAGEVLMLLLGHRLKVGSNCQPWQCQPFHQHTAAIAAKDRARPGFSSSG